ncbi:MAG TPA: hypothetical protein VN641_14315 [Urbifossiella sp.]|nr:hypothetical protein [Urbifossiella sp.]
MFNQAAALSLLNARPFTPFRFVMSDGGTVDVLSREMVLPLRHCVLVALLKPGRPETAAELWTTVWYMHVSRVEFLTPGMPPFLQPPPEGNEAPSSAA